MKILVYDNGLNTESAIAIARAGHSVAYTSPWTEAFPKPAKAWIGKGLEGLEVVESFSKALDKADYVFCPDTFSQDRVHQARAKLGDSKVWGAGHAERMELDRVYMKRQQAALGLRVGDYEVLSGVEELIKHCRAKKNRWIKTSKYRQYETFKHEDWESTRNQHLGAILDAYGPAADQMVWLSEAPLKGQEVGLDGVFDLTGFLQPYGWGYEKKDEAYIGRWGAVLPPVLEEQRLGLSRILTTYKARSIVSNEVIVTAEDVGHMIEPTIRAPHPPMAGMLEMYNNLPAVWTKGVPALAPRAKFCACLVFRSSWAGDHWCEIKIDYPQRRWVKLSQACRVNGRYFAVPGNEFLGQIVGIGLTVETAVKACKEHVKAVSCKEMDVNESALDELMDKTIPEGRKVGISF
jgi:hypothetical protein